jgi:DNA polymerase III epsilon subunit-like protein
MLQLSYVIFDSHTSTVIERYDTLVAPPSDVEVTAEITELTGITAEAAAKGANTQEVLERFTEALKTVEVVIAHNIWFDRKMMNVEAARLGLQEVLEVPERDMPPPTGPKQVCTMLLGAEYARSIGNKYCWSKLGALYTQLYDKPAPEGLHDSRVDTIVCLQCYMHMLHNLPRPSSPSRRRVKDKKFEEAKPVDLPPTRYGRIRRAPACFIDASM